MAKIARSEEPDWWREAFAVKTGDAFPKKPLRVGLGRNSVDATVLDRAVAVMQERARPTGFWGRFWVKTITKTLTNMADAIEKGKI